ncbi:DUF3349 domain-containing protein [Gordonia sp. VNK1]|uniref:DUF3349 domain-containing protein n=1 Tax=Gordonia oleivorans TaxID=3156618 RepID=UPI0032B40200
MADRPLVGRIIDWLRAGYPHGVPERDYNPLLAILRRQLSEEEVEHVSGELISEAAPPPEPISKIDAGVKITAVTHELPHDDDVSRVQHYLEEHGFPFDDAPLAPPDPSPPAGSSPSNPSAGRGAPSDGPPSPPAGSSPPAGRGARSASDEPRDHRTDAPNPPTDDETTDNPEDQP